MKKVKVSDIEYIRGRKGETQDDDLIAYYTAEKLLKE